MIIFLSALLYIVPVLFFLLIVYCLVDYSRSRTLAKSLDTGFCQNGEGLFGSYFYTTDGRFRICIDTQEVKDFHTNVPYCSALITKKSGDSWLIDGPFVKGVITTYMKKYLKYPLKGRVWKV